MIEPIMYFGLGFLAATLLALIIMPFVHGRAERLTTRRLEAAIPVSLAEIQADKDQLRAEFAMSTRRLEMSVDQLKRKTTGQLAELGKKADAINQLKAEVGEKTATIFALEAREKNFKDQLHATEDELAAKTDALHEAERALADKQAELARLTGNLDDRSVTSDSQRVEIVALKTQVDALKTQVADLGRAVKDTEGRLEQERRGAEAAANELALERGQVEKLGERVGQLEHQLAVQTTEAEILGRRVAELETRLAEQARMLGERERERDQLRLDLEAARRVENDLRQELAGVDRRHGAATDALASEKASAEAQLDRAREERAKLQREIAAMKREAETSWAAERVENALLRERINDVAAEVVRLTSVIEGPDSRIEAILAETGAPTPAVNGVPPTGEEPRGSLADRIRALQSRASRLSPVR
jgi:predicted  nucleic acid-binding Zn-ribbon protein